MGNNPRDPTGRARLAEPTTAAFGFRGAPQALARHNGKLGRHMVDRPLAETGSNASRHTLPAIPSSVPTIRHELDRVLGSLRFTPRRAADLKLAVTEACTNAVQHAYPDGSPPAEMVISFEASAEALIVSVLDAGRGIDGPSPQSGLGLGLPIIAALADTVTIEKLRPGTEIRMTFQRRDPKLEATAGESASSCCLHPRV